jgi:hypothetical protein
MPTPIYSLPFHTIAQMRAVAGLLYAYIEDNAPDTNEGEDWTPPADLPEVSAAACHLNAAIEAHDKPSASEMALADAQNVIDGERISFEARGLTVVRDDQEFVCRTGKTVIGRWNPSRRVGRAFGRGVRLTGTMGWILAICKGVAPLECGCKRGDGCCDELPDGSMAAAR